ncbi:hypothetical protein PARMER_02003 [Parabacteroides merdae ATCC 43184]|nr:hypothetical protein PARMER_02003 [Parabacteroides merdae ATCC 43184]
MSYSFYSLKMTQMYLKKSGFICLNVYINLPYLYSIDILRKE